MAVGVSLRAGSVFFRVRAALQKILPPSPPRPVLAAASFTPARGRRKEKPVERIYNYTALANPVKSSQVNSIQFPRRREASSVIAAAFFFKKKKRTLRDMIALTRGLHGGGAPALCYSVSRP